MDYKQIHQQVYEELTEQRGKEPTPQELHSEYMDRIAYMIDEARDRAKYEEMGEKK